MAKKRRTKRASYWGMAATTTSRDWGHGPVPCKGGKTTNFEIQDKDRREQTKSREGRQRV